MPWQYQKSWLQPCNATEYGKGRAVPLQRRKEGEAVRIGIDADLDCILDPQQRPAVCFCEKCGGEIYGDGICLRCERRRQAEDE